MDQGEESAQALPAWVHRLHAIVLFGEPDRDLADRTGALWRQHHEEALSDPAVTRSERVADVFGSVASHIVWRISAGHPTPVAPGLFVMIAGVAAVLFSLSDLVSLGSATSLSGLLGILGGGLILLESRTEDRSVATRCGWSILLLGLAVTVFDLAFRPLVSSDRLSSAGIATILFCLIPMVATRVRSRTSWRPWFGAGIGLLIVGAGNLAAAFTYVDETAARISMVLFVVEVSSGLAAIHWSLSRRCAPMNLPVSGTGNAS